jgi:hypothetical protein
MNHELRDYLGPALELIDEALAEAELALSDRPIIAALEFEVSSIGV